MSPITVIGDSTYIADVECALGKICPGVKATECTSDGNGILTCTIDVSDVHCPGYCAHKAGCNLILAVSEAGDVSIEDGGTFMYRYLDDEIWWWNECTVEDDCADCGKSGSGCLDPVPLLAHELIHAYHDLVTGTYEPFPWLCESVYPEEECTVCATNQIRDELGMPRRCTYGEICVRCGPCLYHRLKKECDYECYLIPTDSKLAGCACATPITEAFQAGLSYLSTLTDWLKVNVEAILERLARAFVPEPTSRAPFGARPDAEARMADDDFGGLTPRGPNLASAYEDALAVLARGRRRWSHPRIESTFDAASHALLLEVVAMPGGYRTLLLAVEDDRVSLLTNVEPSRNESGPRLGSQGDLALYDLGDADDDLRQVFEESEFWDADDRSAGVELDIADGDAHFLRVKSDGRVKRVALKGFRFPTGPRRGRARPTDPHDASRWDAIGRARELGAEWVDALEGPGSVLRRGPGRKAMSGGGGCC